MAICCPSSLLNISHAAIQSTGRIRLPPAKSEYDIASHIFSVCGMVDFTESANAASIGTTLEVRYSFRLKDVDVCDRDVDDDVMDGDDCCCCDTGTNDVVRCIDSAK